MVLDSLLCPKICDFGISALGNETKAITSGSPAYSAFRVLFPVLSSADASHHTPL